MIFEAIMMLITTGTNFSDLPHCMHNLRVLKPNNARIVMECGSALINCTVVNGARITL